ncbi:MAG: hypothetical protein Q9186_007340 [Xanthomendoza sp. 1 TL-2023]
MPEGKSGRWTETEKLALMVSIVASQGTPNWNLVKLPAGRSRMACMHAYYAAMEGAKEVPLGDTKNAGAIKKRGPRGPSSVKNSPAKGKRGHKAQEEIAHESDVSDEEGPRMKKLKKEESDEDDEDTTKTMERDAEEV